MQTELPERRNPEAEDSGNERLDMLDSPHEVPAAAGCSSRALRADEVANADLARSIAASTIADASFFEEDV